MRRAAKCRGLPVPNSRATCCSQSPLRSRPRVCSSEIRNVLTWNPRKLTRSTMSGVRRARLWISEPPSDSKKTRGPCMRPVRCSGNLAGAARYDVLVALAAALGVVGRARARLPTASTSSKMNRLSLNERSGTTFSSLIHSNVGPCGRETVRRGCRRPVGASVVRRRRELYRRGGHRPTDVCSVSALAADPEPVARSAELPCRAWRRP